MSKRKSDIPNGVRAAVLERDGKCRFCGTKFNLTLHHVVHREDDGPSVIENLLTLCRGHHNLVHSNPQRYRPICQELLKSDPSVDLAMTRLSPKGVDLGRPRKPTPKKEKTP